jgi:cytoskeletal protein CcmA (bactofilin family)
MFRAKSIDPTVVGQGAVIEGNLRASGRVQIDGRIEGKLEVQGQVSIGPGGAVVGEVIADEVAIGGRVEGKCVARKHLYVAATGALHGEACYGSLQVERGGVVDGHTVRDDSETAAAERAGRVQRPSSAPAAVGIG